MRVATTGPNTSSPGGASYVPANWLTPDEPVRRQPSNTSVAASASSPNAPRQDVPASGDVDGRTSPYRARPSSGTGSNQAAESRYMRYVGRIPGSPSIAPKRTDTTSGSSGDRLH